MAIAPSPCSSATGGDGGAAGLAAAELGRALLAERGGALREVLRARAALLQGDLELERRGQRGPGGGVHDPLGEPDGHRRAGEQLLDQLVRRGVELGGRDDAVGEPDPLRLLAADQLAGNDDSFARPSPTTCGSREEPPTSGIRPIRVSGIPTSASAAITRRSQASASSSAPPMQAPWIWQTTGFSISSAMFQASRQARRNGRRRSGVPLRSASEPRSIPEENIGPSPRSTTHVHVGVVGGRAQGGARGDTSSWLKALRFSARLRTRWRTAPRSSVSTRSVMLAERSLGRRPTHGTPREDGRWRPPAHRGPLIAAGAVVLALGLALEELRLGEEIGAGLHLLILAAATVAVLGLGLQPRPRAAAYAYQSVLLVTGLLLLYATLLRRRRAGSNFGPDRTIGVLGGIPARHDDVDVAGPRRRGRLGRVVAALGAALLIAALATGIGLSAAIGWIFDAQSQGGYRFLLLALGDRRRARRPGAARQGAAARAAAHQRGRGGDPRDPGARRLAAGALQIFSLFGGFPDEVLPALGARGPGGGLRPAGLRRRRPRAGRRWLGLANLALFVLSRGLGADATLKWWPLILIVLGLGVMAAACARVARCRRAEPLPGGEQPLAARADEEITLRVRADSRRAELGADRLGRRAHAGEQRLDLAAAQQPEDDVLGADLPVAEVDRLAQGELERLGLGGGDGRWRPPRPQQRARAEGRLGAATDLEPDADRRQRIAASVAAAAPPAWRRGGPAPGTGRRWRRRHQEVRAGSGPRLGLRGHDRLGAPWLNRSNITAPSGRAAAGHRASCAPPAC